MGPSKLLAGLQGILRWYVLHCESLCNYNIIFFLSSTCAYLISSASPEYPPLNCAYSEGAPWRRHVCFFHFSPVCTFWLQARRHSALLLRRRLRTAGLEEHQLPPSDGQLCGLERRPAHLQRYGPGRVASKVGPRMTSRYIFILERADRDALALNCQFVCVPAPSLPLLCVIGSFFTVFIETGLTLTFGERSSTSCCLAIPALRCPSLMSHSLWTIFVTGR